MAGLKVILEFLVALLVVLVILTLIFRADVRFLQIQIQEREAQIHEHQIQIQELQKRTRQQTMHISKLDKCQDDLSQKITRLDMKSQKKHFDLNHKLKKLDMKLETKFEEQNEQLDHQNQKINDGDELSYRLRRQELDTLEDSIIQQCKSMIEALEVELKPHNELFCYDAENRLRDQLSQQYSRSEETMRRMSRLMNARIDNSINLARSMGNELRQEISWSQGAGGQC